MLHTDEILTVSYQLVTFTFARQAFFFFFEVSSDTIFFVFHLHRAAYGILVSRPGIEPMSLALKAQILNHKLTKEEPFQKCFSFQSSLKSMGSFSSHWYCS